MKQSVEPNAERAQTSRLPAVSSRQQRMGGSSGHLAQLAAIANGSSRTRALNDQQSDVQRGRSVQKLASLAAVMNHEPSVIPPNEPPPTALAVGASSSSPATAVVQRVPGAFTALAARGLAATTGIGRTSHWEPLLAAINAYRVLDPGNTKDRKRWLNEMGVHLTRWKEARGLPGARLDQMNEAERAKVAALPALENAIAAEYTELGSSPGTLVPAGAVAKPDPRLTTKRSESDARQKGWLFEDADILDNSATRIGTVRAGTACRVEKREGAPRGRHAGSHVWIRQAPTEDATSGTVAEFPSGWVAIAKVQQTNLEQAATKTLKYEDRHSNVLFPLFPAPPTVDDVQQAGLGNCYLLAAIMAVVRRTPGHFPSHMIDNGNGTVTVRLYEVTDFALLTTGPVEITVNKSVVIKKKPETGLHPGYNKNTLWVEMLEKAYAAAGFTGQAKKSMSTSPAWSDIASGDANVALTHLTGTVGTFEQIHSVDPDQKDAGTMWTMRQAILLHVMGVSAAYRAAWEGVRQAVSARIAAFSKAHDEIRNDDVIAIVTELVADVGLRAAVIGYLNQEQIYPGKRGTGRYTAQQKDVFTSIADDLDGARKIVVGSREHMKRGGRDRTGRSGNENVHAGLAGPHGYEVLDYRPANFRTLGVGVNAVFWVKLRNPWGDTGRKYVDKVTNADIVAGAAGPFNARAEKTDDPEFWITLEDLTKRFGRISVIA